jgi:putative hydrolase of the HAD superfamily
MTNLPPIQWVVFDAVGTLIFGDPPPHMAYHRIGQRHGSSITPHQAAQRFREAGAAAPQALQTSPAREREFWQSIVSTVLPDVVDLEACFNDLWQHFAAPTSWGVYADVEETLELLRSRGIQIAIASNFDERLHAVCDGHPELRGIATRFISSEVGWKKPSGEFFAAITQRLAVHPQAILMVGDDEAADIKPALAAGLRALHINRSGTPTPRSITSLTDLPLLSTEY